MGDVVGLPAPVPINEVTDALIVDLARFAEGLQSEQDVRRRHQLGEAVWEQLGSDDALIERIEAEKLRRIRSGELKRERAQVAVVTAPLVMSEIMNDRQASPKHKIDACKVLDGLATGGSAAAAASERFVIHIDLSASGTDEILRFNKSIAVDPNDSSDDSNTISIDADRNDDQFGFAAAVAMLNKRKDDGGGERI